MVTQPGNTYTYKNAGVDIDAGAALVEAIKPLAGATRRAGADAALGGFGALFDLRAAGFVDPILVAATDGVGTKLLMARAVGRHDTIGIDLVAMNVNDLVTHAAEPLFFLDYYATGRLDVAAAAEVMRGIAEGCRLAGCALIGGETAEMPGLYGGGEYDLAGFAVGAAERGALLPRADVAAGDTILGIASTGLHSNGFSLVRRLVSDDALDLDAQAPFDKGVTLGEALLAPTRIYVGSCLAAVPKGVKALAHITGGGLTENLPRVLPDGLGVTVDALSWPLPPLFGWLQTLGQIEPLEMARTFNCGVGMAAVVAPAQAAEVADTLRSMGEEVWSIGRVTAHEAGAPRVVIEGVEIAWPG